MKIGHNVEVKPYVQLLDNEIFTNSACTEDEARLDISAKGIWGSRFEHSFMMLGFSTPMLLQTELKTANMHIYYI